mmetsp:Transcript_23620/g.38349  ORF Transcript_23620/g.38349 Transcript_23620/m.38349 type:complete len:83 (+) Transcript_23620:12-260(+)
MRVFLSLKKKDGGVQGCELGRMLYLKRIFIERYWGLIKALWWYNGNKLQSFSSDGPGYSLHLKSENSREVELCPNEFTDSAE